MASDVGGSVISARARGSAFPRKDVDSFFQRSSTARPASEATDMFDTDFEDESEYEGASPKRSFESVSPASKRVYCRN